MKSVILLFTIGFIPYSQPFFNSLYCGMNLDNKFTNLVQDTWNVYEWFVYNSMKGHYENFQFIILGNTGLHALQIRGITTKSVSPVTLLGITTTWYSYTTWFEIEL